MRHGRNGAQVLADPPRMAGRANYGINAPGVVRGLLVAALLVASGGLIFRVSAGPEWSRLARNSERHNQSFIISACGHRTCGLGQ